MGAIKDYFKSQLPLQMFILEHDDVSTFYLSAFQKNRSAVPLLFLRMITCFGCIAIIVPSLILTKEINPLAYWPIYLTHWGLVLNTIAAAFGVAVSATAYLRGPIEALFGLPWYVKVYWVMTNLSTTIALFITVFYWSFLMPGVDDEITANATLDIFIHVVNSILMLALLLSARQPMRLLHFYQPVALAIVYLIFTLIYYNAGGTHPWSGEPYIYPPLNWSQPGIAVITVVISLFLLILLHTVCVLLTLVRDKMSSCLFKNNKYSISDSYFNFNT